ncbi:MAG: 4-hydroxy-tetrahydrodipicolinate reductase [Lachnospiraceae bacterium]
MRILISGILGHMGREVEALCRTGYRGAQLACGVDISAAKTAEELNGVPCVQSFENAVTDIDCVIDFSHHSGTEALLKFTVRNNISLVLATTGQTDEERAMIIEASSKIPLFFASNYSLGIALLIELAKKTAAAMPDAEIEIIEKHHNRKIDAPSGTALTLANELKTVRKDANIVTGRSGYGKRSPDDIGIHAIRMGNIVGEHEVIIGTRNQTITLKHEAHSRALFAEGALAAAQFLMNKGSGLYDMKDLVGDN